MSIKRKLRQLKSDMGTLPCAECNLRPTGPGYIVYEPPEPRPEQERCAACGRPLYFFIRVVEEGEVG